MNKLILCEGATDAILLSYYLEKVAGWKYSKKAPKNLEIKAEKENETVNWYKRGEDFLMISAVGGKDRFPDFFIERIKSPLFAVNAFGSIAIVTDRDDRDLSEIENAANATFEGLSAEMKNNTWVVGRYRDDFLEDRTVNLLLVVIPDNHQGALETVLLDSISEDPYDRNIVESASRFTDRMRLEASRYISSNRLQLKARLGVTWAIKYPDKIFSLIDEEIRSVKWEESSVLKRCFNSLLTI